MKKGKETVSDNQAVTGSTGVRSPDGFILAKQNEVYVVGNRVLHGRDFAEGVLPANARPLSRKAKK